MATRVHQIAKEYNVTSEEILNILHESGVEARSHTSVLDEHACHILRAKLGGYKLTVVDGEEQTSVTDAESAGPVKKTSGKVLGKKGNKKTDASSDDQSAPRLKVRVIKKTTDEREEAEHQESQAEVLPTTPEPDQPPASPDSFAEEPQAATPQKPKLAKRPRTRATNLKDRIAQKIQKQQETPAPQQPAPNVFQPRDRVFEPRRPMGGNRQSGITAPTPKPRRDRPAPPPPQSRQRSDGKPLEITLGVGAPAAGKGGVAPSPDFTKGAPKMKSMAQKVGKKKKKKRRDQEAPDKVRMAPMVSKVELPDEDLGIIMLPDGCTVKLLAEKVNRMAKDVIKRLFERGVFATINDVLEEDLAVQIAKDFGYLAEFVSVEEALIMEEDENPDHLEVGERSQRAPIVTIMGHVDHGKTSLLDKIRQTRVAEGEAGGITQHIGAYRLEWRGKPIVFLDTPGHEAFTKMRARGASVTDIVILVVAADDGVMPQTIEAINHAKAAKVPIIVAINKIDKPGANPDMVKQMLTHHELLVEDFGGETPSVMVSAKMGQGLEDLLEMILLVADMAELTAVKDRRGQGTVIEAKLERGRGPVASIVLQDGTTRVGDAFISGNTYGRIRAMYDESGKRFDEAGPSTPVEILGLNDVPQAGDNFMVVESEQKAREISTFRKEKARERQLQRQRQPGLDQLLGTTKEETKELALIVKGDVQGSCEGLINGLEKIKSEKVSIRVIHQGVGNISENDVLLAVASKAMVLGFKVKPEGKALDVAQKEEVEIRLYDIIYEAIQDVAKAMLGLVSPDILESYLGRALVRQIFQIPKIGKIAGCLIEDGKITRKAKVRVFRRGNKLFEGKMETLKRFQDDVSEVKQGFECGICVANFQDFEEGDIIEAFELKEVEATELT